MSLNIFTGLTGEIQFTVEGSRFTDVDINQFLNGVRVPIGNSSGNDSGISISSIKWPGGTVPNDGSQEQSSLISLPQFIVFSCFSAVGIVLSAVYIAIVLIRWKHGAINSNTPILTLTTLIGLLSIKFHLLVKIQNNTFRQ